MSSLFTRLKNWIHSSQTFTSEKNKHITLERFLGSWCVSVNDCEQTSPLMEHLWRKALLAIPKHIPIHTILILGFGAGGSLRAIYKRFPKCSITSIEHDPIMIKIATTISPWIKNKQHSIILADAKEATALLPQTFDLILFDLYTGENPSTLIHDKEFLKNLQTRLDKNGYLLVNMFEHKTRFGLFNTFFHHSKNWMLVSNYFALYRHPTHLK